MTESIEQHTGGTTEIVMRVGPPVGELALQPEKPQDLFGVTSEEVLALVPSVAQGGEALWDILGAANPHEERFKDPPPLTTETKPLTWMIQP